MSRRPKMIIPRRWRHWTEAHARTVLNDFAASVRLPGGTRVTLGSDAHRPDHVGAHLVEALALLHEAGLTQVTQFVQRQARPQPVAVPAPLG